MGQKIHTFSYEITKSWDVMYSTATIVNDAILHFCKLLTVNLKNSNHKKKNYKYLRSWVITRFTVVTVSQ